MRQQEDVEDACKGIDYIFHQAAIASVEQSIHDPMGTLDVNLTGTGRLIEAARRQGVRRIVFAGSSAVLRQPDRPSAQGSSTPQPLSPFAIYKLSAEQMLSTAFSLHRLETVTLRYFNVFGPQQSSSPPYSDLIARFVSQMLECGGAEPLTIFGNGEQSRDFVYIDDVVAANLAAMHAPAERTDRHGRLYSHGEGRAEKQRAAGGLHGDRNHGTRADERLPHDHEAQGYFIARPMPYDDLIRFIRQQESAPQASISAGIRN